ncbi:DNA cytosine methyltransferase [Maritimibacter sp. HL-12]|uniref:DNA cytosine methyltransferase n=1 Tax=Maritimibacter sp. HL-12 TaxID=1162418 RepID=UPI000A0F30F5|nr:DNA (cytosine-5-)-methyltransferase [Maritimibacter sp. HL-12]SMH56008.1 DNA (cytosine-5)-methyltransferase 1 [Maritimibacter sp. HL-12]
MRFAEFFAGGGMARAALGADWECVLANDIDALKCEAYRTNWGGEDLLEGDVADLDIENLRQPIDLYWASSPCQDFSLAGKGAGLKGSRSGTFFPWISKLRQAVREGYGPKIVAFENVSGLVTRRKGEDFFQVVAAFTSLGYRVGAMEIDAKFFVPHSRKRLFLVAVRADIPIAGTLTQSVPTEPFHSQAIRKFVSSHPSVSKEWLWWRLPPIPANNSSLIDILDDQYDHRWFSLEKVDYLLSIMSDTNRQKVENARSVERLVVGTIYKRGRPDETGQVRQRAEVRFDGIAGCLRTPAGGSSRQTLLFINGAETRARLVSPREAARLMGLDDGYVLPENYNAAYKLAGDGLAVPVVRFLADHLLQPLVVENSQERLA